MIQIFHKYLTSSKTYICIMGLITFVLMLCLPNIWHDAQSIATIAQMYIQPLGTSGYLVYTALAAVGMCVFIPRQALSFIAGTLFGAFTGSLLAIAACVLGCSMATALGRCVGRACLEKHAPKPLAYLDAILQTKPVTAAITLRLLPTGNNLLFSYLGGVSKAPAGAFILGSGLGYIPQNVLFSLLGAGLMLPPEIMLSMTILAGIIAICMAHYVYYHVRVRLHMN